MSPYYKKIVDALKDSYLPLTSSEIAAIIGGNNIKVRKSIDYEINNGHEFIEREFIGNQCQYSINPEYYKSYIHYHGTL